MATLKKTKKLVFKTNYRLLQVKSISECSKEHSASISECSKEHSAILLTFIKLPHGFKTFVLSILDWRFTQALYCKSKKYRFAMVKKIMLPDTYALHHEKASL